MKNACICLQVRDDLRQEIETLKAAKKEADKNIAAMHVEMQTITNKAAIDAEVRVHLQN